MENILKNLNENYTCDILIESSPGSGKTYAYIVSTVSYIDE